MRVPLLILVSVFLCSCAQPESTIAPEPGIPYVLKDPAQDRVLGTLVFDHNIGYVFTQNKSLTLDGGQSNVTVKIVGHWRHDAGDLVLHDQVYQGFEVFDRWGTPKASSESTLVQIRSEVPLPDCRKVTLSGNELFLL